MGYSKMLKPIFVKHPVFESKIFTKDCDVGQSK